MEETNRNFQELLEAQWAKDKFVCVGLDSDYRTIAQNSPYSKSPNSDVRWPSIRSTVACFNSEIVKTTQDIVCAYKLNIAFYEKYGSEGLDGLRDTIKNIHAISPDVPVILDAKYGNNENANLSCVEAAFDYFRADAITLHPYLGKEALQPFLDCKNKGIIILCRTSNPGAGEFQDLFVDPERTVRLYQYVAMRIAEEWNKNGNCALVVGATYPDELRIVREIIGDMPILIPGIGAQGGNVEKTVSAGMDSRGWGMIINSSRGIIFASDGEDFAEAARRETLKLHELICASI